MMIMLILIIWAPACILGELMISKVNKAKPLFTDMSIRSIKCVVKTFGKPITSYLCKKVLIFYSFISMFYSFISFVFILDKQRKV